MREHLVRGYTLNRKRFEHNAAELEAALALVRKAAAGEALTTDQGRGLVDLFGRERESGLAALLGNLGQSVFGEPAYPTIEAKAAHLLYFVIKNHPFPTATSASAPAEKDVMIRLVMTMLADPQP